MEQSADTLIPCPRAVPSVAVPGGAWRLLPLLLLVACASPMSPTDVDSVTLQRTAHGVVHVTAPDYHGAGYGVGYAYTQDNHCLLAHRVAEVNGRLSAQLGADAVVTNAVHDLHYSALRSDHYYRGWLDWPRLIAEFEAGPPEVLALAEGYAAGVNRAAAGRQGPACAVEFIGPVTRDDVLRMWVATATVTSGEMIAGYLPLAAPGDAAPAVPEAQARAGEATRPFGSNAWAFGDEVTRDGASLHLYNPHFPWAGIQRIYQVHVSIPGELDVMGGTLGGLPLPVVGFNQHLAWGLTLSPASRWTLDRLQLDGDAMHYRVDGKRRAIEVETLRIPVLGEAGPRELPFFRAGGEPLVDAAEFELGWDQHTAYSAHDANAANTRVVAQFLRIGQARSVQELKAAMSEVQGVPWSYVIASDDRGEVYFGDAGSMPDLDAERLAECQASAGEHAHELPHAMLVLDGSRSACDWQGQLPPQAQPQIIRRDYVANSNNNYELPNLKQRLSGYTPLLGSADQALRLRPSLGLRMISERLNGDDDLGEPGITKEQALALFQQQRNLAAELLLDGILADCREHPQGEVDGETVELGPVCAALAAWDRRNTRDSRGALVFRGLWMGMSEGPGGDAMFAEPPDLDRPLTSPAGYSEEPAIRQAVRNALARVSLSLLQKGIALDAAWGEVHQVATPQGPVGMPGGFEPEGLFDAMASTEAYYSYEDWADGLGQPYPPESLYGACYLHLVRYTEPGAGPEAWGVLPYSQATEPASPWYLDQVEPWAGDRWYRFPYTAAEIEADPTLHTQTLTLE